MATQVHPTTKQGSRGELKAAVIFADIGWAPPVKLGEDIGTDLVTFARDTAAPEDKNDAWLIAGGALYSVDLKTGKAMMVGKIEGLNGNLADIAWVD